MKDSIRRTGFTLVELLVVLGIIVLLIGMLLPAVSKARRAGKMAVCLSNLRSFANAEKLYEAQNRGLFSADVTKLFPDVMNATSQSRLEICPAVSDYVNVPETGQYSAMMYYGWNGWVTGVASLAPFNPATVQDSSEVAMMGDVMKVDKNGFYTTGGDGLQDPFWQGTTMQLCRPTFHGRHGGSGSVLWMDGHASLEIPAAVPSTMAVNLSSSSGLTQPPSFFNANHIGYLCRSPNDLTSIAAEYYFVAAKGLLAQNNMMAFLQPTMYPGVYSPVPSQW